MYNTINQTWYGDAKLEDCKHGHTTQFQTLTSFTCIFALPVYQIWQTVVTSHHVWQSCTNAGARRVGESLELHIKWEDGYDAWVSLKALKRQQHCQSAIIDYLVSKVRRKTKG